MGNENFFRTPSAKEFIQEIRNEFLKAQRPADEIILDEADFCKILNISRRHSSDLRREGKIQYAKDGGKIYYKLSWIIAYIDKYTVEKPKRPMAKFEIRKYGK